MNIENFVNDFTSALIILFVAVQLYARRYDLRHFFRTVWYGKEKYSLIKTALYSTPFFEKWSPRSVDEYIAAIKKLSDSYKFTFVGKRKRIVRTKLLDMVTQGYSQASTVL